MANLKHIGRIKNNKRRAIVAYRTLPGDPYSALIVMTESLPADEHDTLIKLVESPAGQQAYELAEVMARTYLPDGRNMLSGFHSTGQLKKVATSDIEMTPNGHSSIMLNELNQVIAQQQGVSLDDIALKNPNGTATPSVVSEIAEEVSYVPAPVVQEAVAETPAEIAKQLRSTADAMFKEAQKLRAKAEELTPTKKKVKEESGG